MEDNEQIIATKLTKEKYRACMLLAAAGDVMGYKNGDWQFNTSGKIIHEQMKKLTENKGVLYLNISLSKGWKYSDDTVMHIATAEGIVKAGSKAALHTICKSVAKEYKKCWGRMSGRAPGKTTGRSIKILNEDGQNWNKIPFADRACGCGGSMRSACIGLAFFNDIPKLIALSIEAGRMTHHNPVGYLGSMVSSYFTALAMKGIHPKAWIAYLYTQGFVQSRKYVEESQRELKLNLQGGFWQKFIQSWDIYAEERKLSKKVEEAVDPTFPSNYDLIEREHFYKKISWNGWPGALGIDSVIIAYDALLSCNGSWQEFCLRGILHGGDNDSTGSIGGAWFGAYYGFQGVPEVHYMHIEDVNKLKDLADNLRLIISK